MPGKRKKLNKIEEIGDLTDPILSNGSEDKYASNSVDYQYRTLSIKSDILDQVLDGKSVAAIARRMGLKVHEVERVIAQGVRDMSEQMRIRREAYESVNFIRSELLYQMVMDGVRNQIETHGVSAFDPKLVELALKILRFQDDLFNRNRPSISSDHRHLHIHHATFDEKSPLYAAALNIVADEACGFSEGSAPIPEKFLKTSVTSEKLKKLEKITETVFDLDKVDLVDYNQYDIDLLDKM